jgi:hypothetical protein
MDIHNRKMDGFSQSMLEPVIKFIKKQYHCNKFFQDEMVKNNGE